MRPYIPPRPPFVPAVQAAQPVPQPGAQQALFSAITFAPQGDLLTLAKDALAAGASLLARDAHGNDVLTLAVVNDRPHAIGTLLALGAGLPDVPDDGIDLLMRAAMLNHSECCHELIQVADLDIDSTDIQGRSALFFAVQAGAAPSARILVGCGADVNLATDRLAPVTLQSLFGQNHQLDARKVTLAMVAVAEDDSVMVDLLSAAGTNLNDGDFPPLHIAADAHDPGLIERLISSGAEVAASLDWETRSPLETALKTGAPMNCLRLLAAHYRFVEDQLDDPTRPLMQAVKAGLPDPLALFLAHGADPGPWIDGQSSAWTQALRHEPEDSIYRLLHLLATVHAERWCNSSGTECSAGSTGSTGSDDLLVANKLFEHIVRSHADPAVMASEGIYPSVLSGLRASLAARPPGDDWRGTAQAALYGATLYFADDRNARFTPQFGPQRAIPPAQRTPDEHWTIRTDELLARQPAWLRQAALQLQQFNINQIKLALTLPFFRRMTDSCPDDTQLAAHISDQLSITSALPTPLTRLIGQAWQDAARHARDWGDERLDLEQAEAFILPHLAMLVARRVELAVPRLSDQSTVVWMGRLQFAAMHDMAVQNFASHPVDWLMRFEQRHHLRAVDEKAIATALICELGLPPATSDQLAHAWADVIQQLATGVRGSSPPAWWRDAARAYSHSVASALVIDERIELPRVIRDAAEAWCVQQTGPLPGRVLIPVLTSAPATTTPDVPPASPIASPRMNLTSPQGGQAASLSPIPQEPPPRPPADRKRAAEPDEDTRKKARHQ